LGEVLKFRSFFDDAKMVCDIYEAQVGEEGESFAFAEGH
jgi:hypothetical protein